MIRLLIGICLGLWMAVGVKCFHAYVEAKNPKPQIIIHCPYRYHQEQHRINRDIHIYCIKNIPGKHYD